MAVVKKDPYAGAVTKPETERGGAAKESVKQPASTSAKVQQPAPAQNPAAASPSTGPSMEGTTYSKHLPAAPVVKRDTYTYDAVRPVYTSPYSTQIDDLLEAVMSREKFSYDLDSDPLYDQYHKQAVREGDRAMRDAMGNAAALTGGYGSSYATTAGSQAYDYYLSQLNDRIPELEQLAYQKYLQEGQDLYDQLAALQGLEADAYGKYRDQVGDFESDRAFDYGVWSDEREQENWQTSFDYQKMQDALAQQNWEREFAYDQQQDALAYALKLAEQQSKTGETGDEGENGASLYSDVTIRPASGYKVQDNLTTNNAFYQIDEAMHRMRDLEGANETEMAEEFAKILAIYERKGYEFLDGDVERWARKYGIADELGL